MRSCQAGERFARGPCYRGDCGGRRFCDAADVINVSLPLSLIIKPQPSLQDANNQTASQMMTLLYSSSLPPSPSRSSA